MFKYNPYVEFEYNSYVEFERNEHGHIVLTIIGFNLTGEQEVKRLKDAGFRVNTIVKSCLLSTNYNENHYLVAGQVYKIALMPTPEIEYNIDRTTYALCQRGIEEYGYKKPLAGIIPRILEMVSDKYMDKMGFRYIVAPHDTINDSDGVPNVLSANLGDVGLGINADRGHPDRLWYGLGAFAFLIPAS